MGSKRRIVKEILPIMLDKEHDTFVDAFCGGCNVITHVPPSYRRIANDKNKNLIAMWRALQDGKIFQEWIPRELYNDARDCYHGKNSRYTDDVTGWIGFMASFNGRFFDGGYSGHNVLEKDGRTIDYISRTIENIKSDIPLLGGVEFHAGSYEDLQIPPKSILYLDPPYFGTKQYGDCRNFNYEGFYVWCMEMARRGHKVFVSEYQMPSEFRCVWEKEIVNSMHQTITKRPVERLFTIH